MTLRRTLTSAEGHDSHTSAGYVCKEGRVEDMGKERGIDGRGREGGRREGGRM